MRFILSLSLLVLAAGAGAGTGIDAAQIKHYRAVASHSGSSQQVAASWHIQPVAVAVAMSRPVTTNVAVALSLPPQAPQLRPAKIAANYRVPDVYPLGIQDHDLDDFTEIIGWRINERWYFGRQDGEDSGLTLVWQDAQDQMSLSKEGIRFTRRF